MGLFLTKLTKASQSEGDAAIVDPFWKYVEEGDEKALETVLSLVRKHGTPWLTYVWEYLPSPDKLSAEEERVMHVATLVGRVDQLAGWLQEGIERHPENEADYLQAYLEACGNERQGRIRAAQGLLEGGPELCRTPEKGPSQVEAFLLSLSDAELLEVAGRPDVHHWLLKLLLQRAPERVLPIHEKYLFYPYRDMQYLNPEACRLLLEYDRARYEDLVAKAFREEAAADSRFQVGVELTKLDAEKYREETAAIVRVLFQGNVWMNDAEGICRWLAQHYGTNALEEIGFCLSRLYNPGYVKHILQSVISILGRETRPAVIAALDNPYPGPRLVALEQLMEWGNESDRDRIRQGFERGFQEDDREEVVRYARSAARDLDDLEDLVWKLLKHKSQLVRDAAARTLGRLGDSAVAEAGRLLEAKSAATRSCAVTVLRVVGTPAAIKLLEVRLDEEPDEEVRDRILLALQRVWESQGRVLTCEEIDQRIQRTLARVVEPIADWLDESRLPPLSYAESHEPLPPQAMRYLLFRQSRAKEMQIDVEAQPLFTMIDRRTSGDFGLSLLRMFLAGSMDSQDRWAMVIAGLLGDDRVVPLLMQQIRAWVDGRRGKMAEYAADALALLGTDVALCALDTLSIRYRSKQRNIGKAASEAFVNAAERLGVTIDELGDRVVPWLGFEPGRPRVVEHGNRRIEVGIGLDFKLAYRDLDKGKTINSLPAAVPPEVKNDYKELAATLREVVKGQLVRVENLMVRQFRWPVRRWRELYLNHPLLFPFAVRLVWGVYGEGGCLQATFRTLEDRTFTDANDEAFEIPGSENLAIGMIHPLELTPEQRDHWSNHLVDYKVESPFLQMERPVLFPNDEDMQVRLSTKYSGSEINAMTLRSRAERLGWQRGQVGESGTIWCYHKSFPGAGADAVLELEGCYVGMDMNSSVSLEKFCFVRAGRSLDDYERCEPVNADDERLIPFGEVPPIVYSEILGDLGKIAGQQEGEEES